METKVRSPAVHLESPRLVVREIQRNDLQQMETWQSFSDPLHRLWNIPRRTSLSREIRFMLHSSDPTKLWFAVQRRPDKRVIGTISLREIVMYESARLGISLGADYVEQGYGSEALRLFLAIIAASPTRRTSPSSKKSHTATCACTSASALATCNCSSMT